MALKPSTSVRISSWAPVLDREVQVAEAGFPRPGQEPA